MDFYHNRMAAPKIATEPSTTTGYSILWGDSAAAASNLTALSVDDDDLS